MKILTQVATLSHHNHLNQSTKNPTVTNELGEVETGEL